MSRLASHRTKLWELICDPRSYYRQAKAHQALGDVEQAQKALKRGLSRPTLATDKALSDLLSKLHL